MLIFFLLFRLVLNHGYHWFIIDERHTNISNIPIRYFESARENYKIHLAYNVYGTQVISGMQELMDYQRNHFHGERQERYFYLFHFELYDGPDPALPIIRRLPRLRMYAGCPPKTVCGPKDYFYDDNARNRMKDLLKKKMFDYSIFFWGGQLKDMDLKELQEYLDSLDNLELELRKEFGVDIRLIYTTDHLPGSSDYQSDNMYPIEDRRRLHTNNQKIREFCNRFHKFLFDIAAIESHTEKGEPCYTNEKFKEVVYMEPIERTEPTFVECNATYGFPTKCLMSNGQICNRKARAFWYLMARLAGYRPYNFILIILVGVIACVFFIPPFFCSLVIIFYFTWGYHLMERDDDKYLRKKKKKERTWFQELAFPEEILQEHWRDFATRPIHSIQRIISRLRNPSNDDDRKKKKKRNKRRHGSSSSSNDKNNTSSDDDESSGYATSDSMSDHTESPFIKREKGKGHLRNMVLGLPTMNKKRRRKRRNKGTPDSTSEEEEDYESDDDDDDRKNKKKKRKKKQGRRKKKKKKRVQSSSSSEEEESSSASTTDSD